MKPLTLLLVDDDADDKELFAEVVGELDCHAICKTAANGNNALEILDNEIQLPDLVFLDLNMPKMDGFSFLKHIKKSERLSSIPIILYTTSNFEGDRTEARKLGADGFITKPHKMETLKPILMQLFSEVLADKISAP